MKYLELIAALSIIFSVFPPAVSLAIGASRSLESSVLEMKKLALVELEACNFLASCANGTYKKLLPVKEVRILESSSEYTLFACTLIVNNTQYELLGVSE